MTVFFAGDDHPEHIEDFSDADAWVDAERREFWRRIHRMSSATYKPTRQGIWYNPWGLTDHHRADNHTSRGKSDK